MKKSAVLSGMGLFLLLILLILCINSATNIFSLTILSIVTFALALFLLLNGPLWLSRKLKIFNRGSQSPVWLVSAIKILSIISGIAGLALWLMVASQGSLSNAVLLGLILILGTFLLLNGPIRLVSRTTIFAHGRQAPAGFQIALTWIFRITGALSIIIFFCLVIWLQLSGI
jgi:hypothetical protein